jgi:glycosyltransferase involved in cell wall biosynthesis
MSSRKKIVVAIDWYLPGYKAGGPIRSVANIISQLKNDFDFSVITSNTDFSDNVSYPNVQSDQWNILEDGTRVYYFSKEKLNAVTMAACILGEKPDIVYMNSFFSRNFTLLPLKIVRNKLKSCRAIIAPRGMLGKGALAIKPLKKLAFISFSKMMGTFDNVRWHASTSQEAEEVKAIFGNAADVQVALNLSAVKTKANFVKAKQENQLNIVFFSRVSRKKNLHMVLKILERVNVKFKIKFGIYGTLEDDTYWSECRALMATLPNHILATYEGVVPSEKITDVFSNYHVSILPTMHENYGHSIVESLANGLPVIISKNTPWQNLQTIKAGWDLELTDEMGFLDAIETAAAMSPETFTTWEQGALALATKVLNNTNTVTQNKLLFDL